VEGVSSSVPHDRVIVNHVKPIRGEGAFSSVKHVQSSAAIKSLNTFYSMPATLDLKLNVLYCRP
jgi:hypothetical protein